MADRFSNLSPYSYAGNNPIRFIDVFGMGPGDRFATPDEAAADFAKTYNDNSIVDKVEYGTTIVRVVTIKKEVYYTYVDPAKGGPASVKPSNQGLGGDDQEVAKAHTHANYDARYDNNNFSPTDMSNADKRKLLSYVATPEGTLKKYDPSSKSTKTLRSDIPSDPSRKNTVDLSLLPKNEPTYGTWDWIRDNILMPIGKGASTIQGKENSHSPQPSAGPAGGKVLSRDDL